MADSAVITLKEVKTQTLTSQKTGKPFTTVELTSSEGQTFSGYDNQVPEGLEAGQDLSINYSPMKTKDNRIINKIITAVLTDGTASSVTTTGTTISAPIQAKYQSTGKSSYTKKTGTSFDSKGARTGGVLHDAVAIAIHNASMLRTSVDLQTVEGLAQELLQMAKRLES